MHCHETSLDSEAFAIFKASVFARVPLLLLAGRLFSVETSRSYVVTLSLLEQFSPMAHLVVVNSKSTEVALGLNHYTR